MREALFLMARKTSWVHKVCLGYMHYFFSFLSDLYIPHEHLRVFLFFYAGGSRESIRARVLAYLPRAPFVHGSWDRLGNREERRGGGVGLKVAYAWHPAADVCL